MSVKIKAHTSCHLTVVGVVTYLLLQVIRGDVVWLRPLTCGRRLEFPTAAVTAAAETAAAVTSGQDPTHQEQTLRGDMGSGFTTRPTTEETRTRTTGHCAAGAEEVEVNIQMTRMIYISD